LQAFLGVYFEYIEKVKSGVTAAPAAPLYEKVKLTLEKA